MFPSRLVLCSHRQMRLPGNQSCSCISVRLEWGVAAQCDTELLSHWPQLRDQWHDWTIAHHSASLCLPLCDMLWRRSLCSRIDRIVPLPHSFAQTSVCLRTSPAVMCLPLISGKPNRNELTITVPTEARHSVFFFSVFLRSLYSIECHPPLRVDLPLINPMTLCSRPSCWWMKNGWCVAHPSNKHTPSQTPFVQTNSAMELNEYISIWTRL